MLSSPFAGDMEVCHQDPLQESMCWPSCHKPPQTAFSHEMQAVLTPTEQQG